jgi:RpiR family transcriptional regulator, carbohydrate utilization regulator
MGLTLDRIDEILEWCGASRAITILHSGNEAEYANALVNELLLCRLEARAQTDLQLRGRIDGRVVLALSSAADIAGFDGFARYVIEGEGKIVLLGFDDRPQSLAIKVTTTSQTHGSLAKSLAYLSLLETLRLGIASRLSRDGIFSDTASDMLQSQREIAYGDARRRDRQSAQTLIRSEEPV